MTWQWLRRLIIGCFWLVLLCFPSGVLANDQGIGPGETGATNPKVRPVDISAQVVAREAPPYPALVSPTNQAILTSGVVTFVWYMSPHVTPLDHFELSLNGVVKFGSIHASNQTTDSYTLTVNGPLYTLQLPADQWLPDGTYTWKVRVVDTNNLGSDSTTWSFTIDSTAPPLLILSLDGDPTAYSATDPSTIPTEPVVVQSRQPQVWGHTEAYATVEIVVTFPNGSTMQYKIQADNNGYFWFTVPTLPLDQPVSLTFTAIDLAQNTTVLDGLQVIYHARRVRIPLPPIFPDLPFIELPFELPTILLPDIRPTPPELPSAPREVIELPVFAAHWWLWTALALVVGYFAMFFWLSGSPWWLFPAWFANYWWWFWGGRRGTHELRSTKTERVVPWLAFRVMWLDEQKRLRTASVVSDWAGRWWWHVVPQRVASLEVRSRAWQYPVPGIGVGEVWFSEHERESWLWGESFTTARAEEVLPATDTTVVVPQAETVRLVAWVGALRQTWVGWSWLPRCLLTAAWLILGWVLWNTRTTSALVLWVALFVMLLRDIWWQTPKRWRQVWRG